MVTHTWTQDNFWPDDPYGKRHETPRPPCFVCGGTAVQAFTRTGQHEPKSIAVWRPICFDCRDTTAGQRAIAETRF